MADTIFPMRDAVGRILGKNSESCTGDATFDKLIGSPRLASAHLEFTTSCNLKCSYCAVSRPTYQATTLSDSLLKQAIDELIALRLHDVNISGHGETTSIPGWNNHARRLIDAVSVVSIISNLSKVYTDEEIETLARIAVVMISVDTVDIELFKRLRRGGDFRRVLYNICAIRSCALRLGIPAPLFKWATVVCDKTVFGLPTLVDFGLALGIRHFHFQNLVLLANISETFECAPLVAMSGEELAQVPNVFDEIQRKMEHHRASFEIQPGLLEAIASVSDGAKVELTKIESVSIFRATRSAEHLTRNCIDPWNLTYISADGAVKPCCIMRERLGTLGVDGSLIEIFHGQLLREYRHGILSGDLKGSCNDCHSRGWVSVDEMARKVANYISQGSGEDTPVADAEPRAKEVALAGSPAWLAEQSSSLPVLVPKPFRRVLSIIPRRVRRGIRSVIFGR